jgi:hypothetical protein
MQGSLISEATGQHTLQVEIEDRGAACTIEGVPRVELLGHTGKVLHFSYKDAGDQMIPPAHPRPVRIAPGRPAFIELNKYRCDIRSVDGGHTIRLTLPQVPTLSLKLGRYPILDWCPAERPSSIIDVSAVEAAPPPVSLIDTGESRSKVVDLLGAPTRAGPRCLVWRWTPDPGSPLDGVRVCFRSGRVATVQTSVHG